MRTKKTFINMCAKFVNQIVVILLGLISRRVMIDSVGVQYLGINGVLENVFTIISLAESGIGVAMVYSLYKPLAEKNEYVIKGLMQFYRKSYHILAAFTLCAGLVMVPFLPVFLKGNTVNNTLIIYFLFLFQAVTSYLFTYKVSLNNADQNQYIVTIINTISQTLVLIIKIAILYFWKNYIVFLTIDIIFNLARNLVISHIVDKMYPFLKDKEHVVLDKEIKNPLYKNIKALFIGKLGYIVSVASDNLVISSKLSVISVGLYSNYTTIISAASNFVKIFISSSMASVGNAVASETKENVYRIFKKMLFINFWIYIVCAVGMFCLLTPFVENIWLGKEFGLGELTTFLIVFNFFLDGIMAPIDSVKSSAGIYWNDRYIPIAAAMLNLILSILFVQKYQIAGVLIGTIVSKITLNFWIQPLLVYKLLFKRRLLDYFVMIIKYLCAFFGIEALSYSALKMINLQMNFIILILEGILILIVVNIILWILFGRTAEFRNLMELVKNKIKSN